VASWHFGILVGHVREIDLLTKAKAPHFARWLAACLALPIRQKFAIIRRECR